MDGAGLDGVTAAWYAASKDHVNVLTVLHMGQDTPGANADLNLAARDGTTPMMAAARNGCTSAIRFLLCEGADWRRINMAKKTALDLAKEFNRSDAQHLLEASALSDAALVRQFALFPACCP